jgi:cytoskeletal protein RodZ
MSSSKKATLSLSYFKVRMLSFLNPLFMGGLGILSLIAFSIWQYWLNPDLTTRSLERSESKQDNQEVSAENNNSNPASSELDNSNNNQTIAPESSPKGVVNNPNVSANPRPEREFDSLLSQSNPTNDIFKPITSENNRRNQGSNTGGKLYEQLQNLPDLFPELLPAQTVNNEINLLGDTTLPRSPSNQYQYQLRTNNAPIGYGLTTTPLGEAVNRVMADTNTPNTQSNYQGANSYNNQGATARTPTSPNIYSGISSGAYGSNSAYGNYGATTGTTFYGNNYGNAYNGAPNGVGVSPAQGYNSNTGVIQPAFPTQYGF